MNIKFKNEDIKNIIITIVAIFMIVLGISVYVKENNNDELEYENIIQNSILNNIDVNNNVENSFIKVHIAGETNYNGILSIKDGSRIADVIEEAGGLKENADLSQVNLACVVEDGQKIYIPNKEEMNNQQQIINIIENQNTQNLKININTANSEELQNISGIGKSLADRIIEYRKENGKFKNIEDIKNVSGFGDKKYEAIKNMITV